MSDLRLTDDGLDEEVARAEVYGLLALLFQAPPSPALLANLRLAVTEAPVPGAFLEEPFRQLVGVARARTDAEVATEYDALFGGVGKPDVLPYGSHFMSGFLNDKPLAQLRADLAQLGLGRDETTGNTEDHVAYLCEVMRYLIAGDDVGVANLAQQQHFYTRHLQPWIGQLAEQLRERPGAPFYQAVGVFLHAFAEVEAQGFDLVD